jgi:hypothetical protein
LKEEVYQLREQLSYLYLSCDEASSRRPWSRARPSRAARSSYLPSKQMKESFEIEKTTKIQEEELTDLENNYKLLRHTFEETRKKHRNDWENEL